MTKLLALLITTVFALSPVVAKEEAKPVPKKPAAEKKEEKKVKKHKKAEGTAIPEPAKKDEKKKK